ncbi:MAG: hypothetical protein ACM3JH_01235 [Acidithiobacillales bacterium]
MGSSSARVFLIAALIPVGAAGSLLAADVYGRPLRGLTAVPVREAVTEPERFAGLDIRVTGPNAGSDVRPVLKEGDAVLPILTDGSFTLPAKLDGMTLTAEGSLRKKEGDIVFVATGVEVTR